MALPRESGQPAWGFGLRGLGFRVYRVWGLGLMGFIVFGLRGLGVKKRGLCRGVRVSRHRIQGVDRLFRR